MSYRADKQVIDTHTHRHTDRHTDAGDDNTRRPKLASGKKQCCNSIETLFDTVESEHISTAYVIGDMNINMMNQKDSAWLRDTMETHGLINIINEPTCFKAESPTLIDMILTTRPKRVANTLNLGTGLSDFHNLVCFSTKICVPRKSKDFINYRSYKHFDINEYKNDISSAPYHVGEIFDDLDDKYWFTSKLMTCVTDFHAPRKTRKPVDKPVPFMNARLRKACHTKAMARNKFFKCGRTQRQWEKYRKLRNTATKIKVSSMRKFFDDKCNSEKAVGNSKMFWDTIKPFMTDKVKSSNESISIKIGNSIVNEHAVVANAFNEYFSHVASTIGNDKPIEEDECIESIIESHNDHLSLHLIRDNVGRIGDVFNFQEVNECEVKKLIENLNPKKGPGYDMLPPKLIKAASAEFTKPLTSLVNQSVKSCHFPEGLKLAELAPLYKSCDSLHTGNYRPVNILTCFSKIFERVYYNQLYGYFDKLLSSLLAAFRKHYNCQHVLINLIEKCRKALDSRDYIGLILMDLSKAFDCLPHRLFLCKLHTYGVSKDACQLIRSYLMNRRQRVKVGCSRSDWMEMNKGVPQGSVLGPLLFNIFINDLILYLHGKCSLFNYADDNTIGIAHTDLHELKDQLVNCTNMAIKWFDSNHMKSNASKFQAMIMKPSPSTDPIMVEINGCNVQTSDCVKLLGIHIDDKLRFQKHISVVCSRASRQINAMNRVSKFLSKECKIKLYNAFILSNFLYCSIVWHFCSSHCSYKMEKIQKRALRVVLNDYQASYQDLLNEVSRPTLYVSRMKAIAIEMFKCVKNISPIFLKNMFAHQDQPYELRGGSKFIQPLVRTTSFGINSFRYEGTKIWNNLPQQIKNANDVKEFKQLIQQWSGPKCHCRNCILCNASNV